ncbi:acylphosphatase [Vibrio cincinnatiensis]|uniref:acylphosphatase n=1 Tax=Vibrio cincinnatiensis TaxID=675 RepID=UPI001EE0B1F3|nr:acylphosphatase [Vibrio cincinnatiensis]MCG3758915.1 acylphosphatase [Vibrio cincinnatiensis]MCG3762227.1 acylphosphatase [Vibrio cincinnatiensis]
MTVQCDKFIVSGMVQGVGLRYHTAHQALKLGLTGYAKNLNSGDVEVVACGDQTKIKAFFEWLQKGPKSAQVDQVERSIIMLEAYYQGFQIL